jgi:hypothetical protein
MAKTLNPSRQFSSSGARSGAHKAKVVAGVGALAVLVGAAVAACGGTTAAPPSHVTGTHTVSSSKGSSSGKGSGSPSVTTTLPGGGQADNSPTSPFSHVGPGWSLAIMSGSGPDSNTLMLVSPTGYDYIVKSSLPDDMALGAWSGDGQRALLMAHIASGTIQFTEVELATGAILHQFTEHSTATDDGPGLFSYTQPHGLALLQTQVAENGPATLVRTDLDGSIEVKYPTTFPGGDRPTPYTEPDFTGQFLDTPDGTEIVLSANIGMAVVSNDGAMIRVLDVPTTTSCTPVEWWQPGVVLAGCNAYNGTPSYWLVPDSGATPTYFGPVPTSVTTVYQVGGADYANADDACKAVLTLSGGSWRPADIAGIGAGNADDVVGSYDGQLELLTQPCDSSLPMSSSYIMYNLSTGTSTMLVEGTTDVISFPATPIAG